MQNSGLPRVVKRNCASDRIAHSEAAGRELTFEDASLIADMGVAHISLRWVRYYVGRVSAGHGPPLEWRRSCYNPCLERLSRIHQRRSDWGHTV